MEEWHSETNCCINIKATPPPHTHKQPGAFAWLFKDPKKDPPPLQIVENVLRAARLLNDLFWLYLSMYMVLCCSNSFRSLRISQIQVTSFFLSWGKLGTNTWWDFFFRSFIMYYRSTFALYVAHCSHMYPPKSWKFSPSVIKSSNLFLNQQKKLLM